VFEGRSAIALLPSFSPTSPFINTVITGFSFHLQSKCPIIRRYMYQLRSLKRASLIDIVGLLLYSFLICLALEAFPPYFFCDEAIHGLEAHSILEHGTALNGEPWPLFFKGLGQYQLSFSVYTRLPFIAALGMTVESVRLPNALVSILGVLAFMYLVKQTQNASKQPTWIPYLLLVSPVWYLHARSGFEALQAVSYLLLALSLYIQCFSARPYSRLNFETLFLAVGSAFFFALTFYTYTAARGWVFFTLLALGLGNLIAHLKNFKASLIFICFFCPIFLGPYWKLHFLSPEVANARLEAVGYPTLAELFTEERLGLILNQLGIALNPGFWFTWSGTYTSGAQLRHIIPEHGLFPWFLAPFLFVGVWNLLRNIGSLSARSILLATLASPLTGALAEINSLRSLATGCLYFLIACIGLGQVLQFLYNKVSRTWLITAPILLFCVLYLVKFQHFVLYQARHQYSAYDFYGIQYGAADISEWISTQTGSEQRIFLASNIFNAAESLLDFFLDTKIRNRIRIAHTDELCDPGSPIFGQHKNSVWIIPVSSETEATPKNCPLEFKRESVLHDPNMNPLYVIGHYIEVGSLDEFQRHHLQTLHKLEETQVKTRQGPIDVAHSKLFDSVEYAFDGNLQTLTKTARVNPLRIQLRSDFSNAHEIKIIVSHARELQITLAAILEDGITLQQVNSSVVKIDQLHNRGEVAFILHNLPFRHKGLQIEIKQNAESQFAIVHLNEVSWQ
jgi:hypothetical protein